MAQKSTEPLELNCSDSVMRCFHCVVAVHTGPSIRCLHCVVATRKVHQFDLYIVWSLHRSTNAMFPPCGRYTGCTNAMFPPRVVATHTGPPIRCFHRVVATQLHQCDVSQCGRYTGPPMLTSKLVQP